MGLVDMAAHLADLGSPVSTCTAALLGLLDRVRETISSDRACLDERGAHNIPLLAYTAFGLHLAVGKGHLELAEVLVSTGPM